MAVEPIATRDLLDALPEPWPEPVGAALRSRVADSPTKVVVLDDDPTGTQTVHDLWVWTDWSLQTLRAALADARNVFYLLTNSRSLPESEAVALNRAIASRLATVSREIGCNLEIISRSDSTLRGHFWPEIQALRAGLETELDCRYDGILVCPCFPEGGRITAHDIHWVIQGDRLIPAGQTEYARDLTFGYRASNLREWVAEKTAGAIPAEQVLSIPLSTIRGEGPEGVLRLLQGMSGGRVAIVNAVTYDDLDIIAEGLLRAEEAGQRFLLRTAASIVRARAGLGARPLLNAQEMAGERTGPGLVVVGSYVERTTRQLERALARTGVRGVELDVENILDPVRTPQTIEQAIDLVNAHLGSGHDTVLYTSRGRITSRGLAGDLDIGARVSQALVAVVRGVTLPPRYLIAKGGITSSDIATQGLGVCRAWVLGQILPGVPVWRLGAESRFPDMPYVVFPGNVGDDEALAAAMSKLSTR